MSKDSDKTWPLVCPHCDRASNAVLRGQAYWPSGSTAWNRTVDAQVAWTGALRAHPIGAQFRRLAFVPFQVEHVLFPHIAFMSAGMIVRKSECTICGEMPGECEHVRGHVYGGKFAGIHVTEVDLRDTSIVDLPADKRCRMEQITMNGFKRDALTWEILDTPDRT